MISAQMILETEQHIKTLHALLPTFIDQYAINAKIKREKFNALTKEGFTEEQAMQIIVAGKENLSL